jgi:pyruvate,water dikinase
LEFDEVRRIVASDSVLINQLGQLIEKRRSQLQQDSKLDSVPALVYGNAPPASPRSVITKSSSLLQGIGASPGLVEGRVKVLRNLQALPEIDRETILVVPYTDSGWAPLLARAGGLIAEVGGTAFAWCDRGS